MAHVERLQGVVDRFLFQNKENGYAVFVLQINATTTIVAKGYLPALQAGQEVVLSGTWITHPKFGKQFDTQGCTTQAPTTIVGLKKYLGSGLIKGIGPVYADKLVDYFGADILSIIDKEPQRLYQVPGIGPKRIEQIIASWQDQKEISHVMVYLQDKGISTAFATKIYKSYGANSIATITQNPYRLAEEIWGIGFKMADRLAQAIGIAPHSLARIKAGLLHGLAGQTSQGHLYTELTALKTQTLALLELEQLPAEQTEPLLKTAFHDLYNENKIKLVTHNEQHYIAATAHYVTEKGTAAKLLQLIKQPLGHTIDTHEVYQSLRGQIPGEISLNQEQQEAIITCLQQKVTIITGGPGTGKTTVIKKLLQILDAHKLRYKLAAPTGKAAKRITQSTGKMAVTIHRLLEFDFTQRGFSKNEQNAIECDFLIIDEASMIDIFLAYAIIKAVPYTGHLVFIGDIDQLPSVGAGNFLRDLINSRVAPTITLQHIFRQAHNSLIVVNAHRVNKGEFPLSHCPDAKKDFLYIKEEDPSMVLAHLDDLFLNKLSRFGIDPAHTMVLAPMNRGIVGIQTINTHLQALLNPSASKRISHHFYTYMVGDRVMQIRNNYDKAVFNGDTGTIEEINISDKIIQVRFYDTLVSYESDELDELVLAYAISIHKSQGSEYPAVIIPLFMQHFTLLARNLVYTAITRAKRLCIIIGQPRALAMAIKNNKNLERITFLKEFLTTDLQCR